MTFEATRWTALLILATSVASRPAEAAVFLAFTPDAVLETDAGSLSPEGCINEGLARARLAPSSAGSTCHSGAWGVLAPTVFVGDFATDNGPSTALFETDPLPAATYVAGPAHLVVYYFTTNQNNYVVVNQTPTTSHLEYAIDEVRSSGEIHRIGYGRAFELPGMNTYPSVERGAASFELPVHILAAGSRLRVSLTSAVAPDGRLLFGDQPLQQTPYSAGPYTDAGIWLEMGAVASPPADEPPLTPEPPLDAEPPATPEPSQEEGSEPAAESGGGGGGAPGWTLLLPLLAAARRRRA